MEELKSKILSGEIRPGAKLPSENELAKEYEISRHTVRKALAILATDGYITTEHGKGTFCSDRMAHRKNSKNIAVVTTYISDYIFPRLIQGMDRVLTEQGYSIMLKNTGNSRQKEAQCLEDILTKDVDGLSNRAKARFCAEICLCMSSLTVWASRMSLSREAICR